MINILIADDQELMRQSLEIMLKAQPNFNVTDTVGNGREVLESIQKIKPATKGPDSVLHGIQKLQNYQIIIHPTCTGVINEFENYTWQKDKYTGVYINKPIDEFNHYLDALRYSLQCVGTKLKTFDKNLL